MDDRLRRRVQTFVEQLLTEEKSAIRAAETLLDIEQLSMEVGDEIARQLASGDLAQRSREAAEQRRFSCPECGRECDVEPDLEPLILRGPRGEIEYSEPRCHCRSCRRDFFPGGEAIAASRT
jgi:Zn finger protein HypA/HybF involved in hydrogenase expression